MADAQGVSLDAMQAGDCLLYSGSGPFSWFIKAKTWSRVSHVEVYIGHGRAVASRDGQGVNNYPFRTTNLVEVLRPVVDHPFDLTAALQWYGTVQGRPYDWKQLFTFLKAGRKQLDNEEAFFCSEFAARFYANGGFHPFATHYAAAAISPGMFRASPHFTVVWSSL